MFYVCVRTFNVTDTVENFLELNRACVIARSIGERYICVAHVTNGWFQTYSETSDVLWILSIWNLMTKARQTLWMVQSLMQYMSWYRWARLYKQIERKKRQLWTVDPNVSWNVISKIQLGVKNLDFGIVAHFVVI